MMYKATLTRGNVYVYNGKPYEYGKPVIIDEDTKLYLEEHANLRHKSKGQVFLECQFEFEELSEEDAELAEAEAKSSKKASGGRSRTRTPTPAASGDKTGE